jgi:hypothetical protein
MQAVTGCDRHPLSGDELASASKPMRPVNVAVRIFFTALLLTTVLLASGLWAESAEAGLLITTTGTITSGSETGGLFGLPIETTSLIGDSYTLMVNYDNLGPDFVSDGGFAEDTENSPGVTGFVIAMVNGHPLITPLTNSLGSSLFEDMFDFDASNEGFDGPSDSGAFVNVFQELSCSAACVPHVDLIGRFNYALTPDDFGTDLYTFEGAGFPAAGTPTADFIGTEISFAFVPEPASWVLLATALLALGVRARRRHA